MVAPNPEKNESERADSFGSSERGKPEACADGNFFVYPLYSKRLQLSWFATHKH